MQHFRFSKVANIAVENGNFGNFGKSGIPWKKSCHYHVLFVYSRLWASSATSASSASFSATSASYRQLRQVCGHGRLHVSWGGRLRSAAPVLEPGSGDPEGFDVRLAVGVVGFMAPPLSSTMEAVTQEPSKVRPAAPPVTCVFRCVRCAPCDWCLVRRVAVWCVELRCARHDAMRCDAHPGPDSACLCSKVRNGKTPVMGLPRFFGQSSLAMPCSQSQ